MKDWFSEDSFMKITKGKNVTSKTDKKGFQLDKPSYLGFKPILTKLKLIPKFFITKYLKIFQDDWAKNVTSECLKGWLIWVSELHPIWPNFQTHAQTISPSFTKDKSVTSIEFKRVFTDLSWWPTFWANVTHFQMHARNFLRKHSEQVSWSFCQKYGECS